MKKIFCLLLFSFILTSCTSGDEIQIENINASTENKMIQEVEETTVDQGTTSEDDETMQEFENILLELIESEE